MSELKPCPFCGGEAYLTGADGVCCSVCYCGTGPGSGPIGEAATWNRREPDWRELAREAARELAEYVNYSTRTGQPFYYRKETPEVLAELKKAGLLEE